MYLHAVWMAQGSIKLYFSSSFRVVYQLKISSHTNFRGETFFFQHVTCLYNILKIDLKSKAQTGSVDWWPHCDSNECMDICVIYFENVFICILLWTFLPQEPWERTVLQNYSHNKWQLVLVLMNILFNKIQSTSIILS